MGDSKDLIRAATLRARMGARVSKEGRLWRRGTALLVLTQLAVACAVPGHMHVVNGVAPQNVDTNVRFRTTYYFRVFDYCWSANADIATGKPYQKVVPETDTLYRYRMTGKASALASKIRFESGTLSKERIDPFGANVAYNDDIGGFVYRSQEEAERQAREIAAERAREGERARSAASTRQALQDYNQLKALHDAAPAGTPAEQEIKGRLKTQMDLALQRYLTSFGTPLTEAAQRELDTLKTQIAELKSRAPTQLPTEQLTALQKRVEALETSGEGGAFCSLGEFRRRGFQIMGPEGMRPFDQDERLILAMHSSAKPLIETLNEYSGRLLKPKVNAAEQLLPLARETTTTIRTQRAADRVLVAASDPDAAAKPTLADVFDQVQAEFSKGVR